jgi:Fe-S cluster assembly protein SufD
VNTSAIPLTAGATVPGPEATRPARLDALAALDAAGWPTRRREQWRYTDLEPLAADGFELVAGATDETTLDTVRSLLTDPSFGDASRQLVLLDGQRVAGLGATAVAGLEIAAPEERWSEFVRLFAQPIAATQHPLAALNTAFGRHGLWLKIRGGAILDAPIHLVVVGSRARLASQPRIVIEAEPGAQATFVQHFVDCRPDAARGWTNCVTQLRQAEGSRVSLFRLQRHGGSAVHTSLLAAELATKAVLTAGYFDLGARLVRNDVAITLSGADARTDLFGLLLAGAGQHVDDHTVIRHAAGATVSSENFRGIIGGRGVFNGKVIVEPGCQRVDARQNNDNLLLGDHAEIDTKPELEIYANDVKCSHGTTVGELDAEQLFYLRARGLDAASARRLLTTAFATAIVEQIPDSQLRTDVLAHVTARLATLTEH